MDSSAVVDRLTSLIDDATSSDRSGVLDARLAQDVRTLVKSSPDERVSIAFEIVFSRVLAPNSQRRLLALQLLDDLFQRSAAFRGLVVSSFRPLVEAVIGHRPDRPLPGPPASAEALRAHGLVVIEKWREGFGNAHPEITAAYRYLKSLDFRFPEIRARAAAADAERAARTARTQQLLRAKAAAAFEEFPQLQRSAEAPLREMAECFDLLGAGPLSGDELQQSLPELTAEPDILEWEEAVGGAASQLDGAGSGDVPEGLSAYGVASTVAGPVDGSSGSGVSALGVAPRMHAAALGVDPVVLETLGGLAKQLSSRCLVRCQEWLRILVQVDLSGVAEESARREQLLRSLISFRNLVQAAITKAQLLGADVEPIQPPATRGPNAEGPGGSIPDGGLTVRLTGLQPALMQSVNTFGAADENGGGDGSDDEECEGEAAVVAGSLSQYQRARAARGRSARGGTRRRSRTAVGTNVVGSGGGDAQDSRKRQRELERAHNEAAISGGGDVAAARRLLDAERAASAVAPKPKAKTPGEKLRKLLLGKK